jgi:tRNA(Arg) A34 adenosine deaminase TadA
MNKNEIINSGKKYLSTIDDQYKEQRQCLEEYNCDDKKYPDDIYAWFTCVLALKAVNEGNFGIGSILINSVGDVVVEGHNEVFKPRFSSDRHGEMVVMDKFEEAYPKIKKLQGYTLYTSLESCPMCLARLITSGVTRVLHVAPDEQGGMVHKMNDLPPVWIELAKNREFKQANCTDTLKKYADEIFQLSLKNNDELSERTGYPVEIVAWTDKNQCIHVAKAIKNELKDDVILPLSESELAPSITCFKGNLYLAWVSLNNGINITSSSDGKTFSNKVALKETTTIAPHLSVVNGMLCLNWKGNGNNYLNTMYSFDGVIWLDKSTLKSEILSEKISVCDGNFD